MVLVSNHLFAAGAMIDHTRHAAMHIRVHAHARAMHMACACQLQPRHMPLQLGTARMLPGYSLGHMWLQTGKYGSLRRIRLQALRREALLGLYLLWLYLLGRRWVAWLGPTCGLRWAPTQRSGVLRSLTHQKYAPT